MSINGFYFDPQSLAGVRNNATQREALEETAQQFEALFVHMLLKQMRQTSFDGGLFESSEGDFFRDMFDAQMAQHVGGRAGLGIADMLVQQLASATSAAPPDDDDGGAAAPAAGLPLPATRTPAALPLRPALPTPAPLPLPVPAMSLPLSVSLPLAGLPAGPLAATASVADLPSGRPTAPATPAVLTPAGTLNEIVPATPIASPPASAAPDAAAHTDDWDSPQAFLAALRPHARRVGARLGLPGEVLLAQATLETGWGERLPRHPDGRNSFNVFGIKADTRWSGERVAKPTLEFENGAMQRQRAEFRAYDSAAASFDDYASFLRGNPRYQEALAAEGDPTGYLHALQQAGYATDPAYADKILNLMDSDRFRNALTLAATVTQENHARAV